MRKKMLSTALGLTIFASTAMPANAAITFEDLRGHWAKDTVEFAVQDKIVDGYQDGTFKPDNSISRAEFIKMAITALQFKPADAPGEWYAPYVKSAMSNGIYIDNEFTTGDMNTPITREEMSRLAVRATGESNYDPKKWMYLATSKGIINGMDDSGTLGPEEATTRAQAVTVIRRVQKIRGGASLPKDKYAISAAEIYWHKTNVITMLPQYFGDAYMKGWSKFRDDLLRYDGTNGYSEVEKYIVIDMDDLNDPNRKFIPSDFRWRVKQGGTISVREDSPTNAYALLSFNHVFADFDQKTSLRFASLNVYGFSDGDNVDSSGRIVDVTPFASYDPKYQSLLNADIKLNQGHNEIRFITGQLLPKGEVGKNGDYYSIYRSAAQELGENVVNEIFISHIDYSLKPVK